MCLKKSQRNSIENIFSSDELKMFFLKNEVIQYEKVGENNNSPQVSRQCKLSPASLEGTLPTHIQGLKKKYNTDPMKTLLRTV